jgi:hypothetical protein
MSDGGQLKYGEEIKTSLIFGCRSADGGEELYPQRFICTKIWQSIALEIVNYKLAPPLAGPNVRAEAGFSRILVIKLGRKCDVGCTKPNATVTC